VDHEFIERHLALSASSSQAVFGILDYFMITSYEETDFGFLEGETDTNRIRGQLSAAFKSARDKERFGFEFSLPAHERRHLLDLISTPFGLKLFHTTISQLATFLELLRGFRDRSITPTRPFRTWMHEPNCPSDVISFVRTYDEYSQALGHYLSKGRVQERKDSSSSGIFSVIIEESSATGLYRCPYVGYRENVHSSLKLYPINGMSILEGLGFQAQLQSMDQLESLIAVKAGCSDFWCQHLFYKEKYWQYWSTLLFAAHTCDYNAKKTTQILEFSLMTPSVPPGGSVRDPEELDPGFRLYWLIFFIFKNKPIDVESAIDLLCKDKGWQAPRQVVRYELHQRVEPALREAGQPSDVIGVVLTDFLEMASRAFVLREEYPLRGGLLDVRWLNLSLQTLPPLHLKIKPGGMWDFRVHSDPLKGGAWAHFKVLTAIMESVVDHAKIKCPFALGSPGPSLPGDGKCTCNSGRERCFAANALDRLGVLWE